MMNVYLIAHHSPARLVKAIREAAKAFREMGLSFKEAEKNFQRAARMMKEGITEEEVAESRKAEEEARRPQ